MDQLIEYFKKSRISFKIDEYISSNLQSVKIYREPIYTNRNPISLVRDYPNRHPPASRLKNSFSIANRTLGKWRNFLRVIRYS